MPLAGGTRFGPYEIVAPLGAGGMGEVYKARDTRLDRTVAIKVLPSHIADREELRLRFEREAHAVSSLKHPHICTLYDIGRENGTFFMVMEHLEGETLADRLQRGPLPLDQALKYAIEIGDAIDRAHRTGVIHRDLKPGNIMLTRDGAKVLDFGLAKTAVVAARTAAAAEATVTVALTSEGTVLGTPQYMAPEQIEGSEADARTDIFTFGCVLYEMVTGARAFDGKSKASVAAAILAADPRPMSTLQPVTPPALERAVKQCLAKDPEERWHSLHDVVLQLHAIDSAPEHARKPSRSWAPWAITGMLSASLVLCAFLWMRTPTPEPQSIRFFLNAPEGTQFMMWNSAPPVSPDGRYVVFSAAPRQKPGLPPLWLRPLDSLTAQPLPGSDGGVHPFWSPDSKSVAYYAGGKLKRSDISGGAPQILCDAGGGVTTEGTWGRNGTILFASKGGIFRVPSSGGIPQQLTQHDDSHKESGHGAPQFLPDGKRFLFFVRSPDANVQGLHAASLDNPADRVRVLATDHKAYYSHAPSGRTGILLFIREHALLAQQFDVEKLRLEGEPTRVAEQVDVGRLAPYASYRASDSGFLAYHTRTALSKSKLVWMSRNGELVGVAAEEDRYTSFRLSPDGTRVAVGREDDRYNLDLWSYEFGRKVMTRLTFDSHDDGIPVWSPDSRQIAFYSDRTGRRQIFRKDANGAAQEEQLTTGSSSPFALDWSHDGTYLLYLESTEVWALPLTGDRKPFKAIVAGNTVAQAQLSPDGKWIAYTSWASGRAEVFVRSFPTSEGEWQVSNHGGTVPKWRRDGKELFYLGPDRNSMMAAAVRISGGRLQTDAPHELFRITPAPSPNVTSPYEATADGRRFLVMVPTETPDQVGPVTVITNWQAALKK